MIDSSKILVNIDEVTFGRSTNSNTVGQKVEQIKALVTSAFRALYHSSD